MKVYEIHIFNSSKKVKDLYCFHTAILLAIYKQLSLLWIIRVKIILKSKNSWI